MSFNPARLESIIQEAGLQYRTTGKSFIFTCPLCHKAKKLYISREEGFFTCFKCSTERGFSGAPEFALHELTGRSIAELRKELYGPGIVQAGTFLNTKLDLFQEDDDEEGVIEVGPPAINWAWNMYPLDHKWSTRGVKYLAGRGVPLDIALTYKIRYCPQSNSVIFPVFWHSTLVGWQHRVCRDDLPEGALKTWSSDDIPRQSTVMFAHNIGEQAILCEGPMDALKCHLVPGGGGVATMGKVVSANQIALLVNAGIKRLYVALDPDAVAEIEPVLERVGRIPCYQVLVPDSYKDLGAMPMDAVPAAIAAAEPLRLGQMRTWFKNRDLLFGAKE